MLCFPEYTLTYPTGPVKTEDRGRLVKGSGSVSHQCHARKTGRTGFGLRALKYGRVSTSSDVAKLPDVDPAEQFRGRQGRNVDVESTNILYNSSL